MKFGYKNLSKSLLCMVMPMLMACGGKSHRADNSSVDSMVYKLDSIEARYNKADAAEETYTNAFNDIMYYAMCCRLSLEENKADKDAKILLDYQTKKMYEIWDSLQAWRFRKGVLESDKIDLEDSIPQINRKPKTALDSIKAEYDRAVVAEQCGMQLFDMFERDYAGTNKRNDHNSKLLSTYQLSKFKELSNFLKDQRNLQKELLAEQAKMQKTK